MKLLIILFGLIISLAPMADATASEPGNPALGASQWADNCNRCHNMRDPTEFEAQLWRPIMTHMRLRAGLTGQETRNILAFLQGSAANANQRFRVTPVALNSSSAPGSGLSGESIYQTTCVACHGVDGSGVIPGTPNFTSAKSPLASKGRDELLHNIYNGFQSEGSPMAMPARGGNPALSEQDMKNVLDYLLATYGN